MFEISDKLRSAVSVGDSAASRKAVVGYIVSDPYNEDGVVEQAAKYVIERGVELWEPNDDSTPLDASEENWTPEYAAKVQSDLEFNFSEERFYHWLKVASSAGKKRRAEKASQAAAKKDTATPISAPHTHEEPRIQSHNDKRPNNEISNDDEEMLKKILIGVGVAAAVVIGFKVLGPIIFD